MTINCKGKLLNFDSPIVMGILNVTPDSFYDGGNLSNEDKIIEKANQMLSEGATILDVGGYSSKPGAT
ncbi:MAG: dihydropteroate synthase, partial [Flavobacteriales bacterium]